MGKGKKSMAEKKRKERKKNEGKERKLPVFFFAVQGVSSFVSYFRFELFNYLTLWTLQTILSHFAFVAILVGYQQNFGKGEETPGNAECC